MSPNDELYPNRTALWRNVGSKREPYQSPPTIDLFDPEEICRKIGIDDPRSGGVLETITMVPLREDAVSSQEEISWRNKLKSILIDPRNPERLLLIADGQVIARIDGLTRKCPHFKPVIEFVARAATLSMVTGSAISIPPIFLVGAAGIGKTYFAREFAETLGTNVERVAVDMLSDRGALTGLSLSWRGARPGRIASALLDSPTASPIFLLDEVDKVSPIHREEQPLAFLHTVLERENASHFQDEYLTFKMRADHAIWLMTANTLDSLTPSVLDRITIFRLEEPSPDHLTSILQNLYASVNARFNFAFEKKLSEGVVSNLIGLNPRSVRKLVEMALGHAVEHGRRYLTDADISDARMLLDEVSLKREVIGFLKKTSDPAIPPGRRGS